MIPKRRSVVSGLLAEPAAADPDTAGVAVAVGAASDLLHPGRKAAAAATVAAWPMSSRLEILSVIMGSSDCSCPVLESGLVRRRAGAPRLPPRGGARRRAAQANRESCSSQRA